MENENVKRVVVSVWYCSLLNGLLVEYETETRDSEFTFYATACCVVRIRRTSTNRINNRKRRPEQEAPTQCGHSYIRRQEQKWITMFTRDFVVFFLGLLRFGGIIETGNVNFVIASCLA